MAKLDKKSDDNLSDYYKVFIAMCKRQAGVKLTEEEKGLEGLIDDVTEDHAKLILDRLELLSKLREIVKHPKLEENIKLCENNLDTPDWWQPGKHDRELIRAVLKHGIYRSDQLILNDPEFPFYDAERKYLHDLEVQIQLQKQLLKAEKKPDVLAFDNNEITVKLEKGEGTLKIEKIGLKKEDMEDVKEEENASEGETEEKVKVEEKEDDKVVEKDKEEEEKMETDDEKETVDEKDEKTEEIDEKMEVDEDKEKIKESDDANEAEEKHKDDETMQTDDEKEPSTKESSPDVILLDDKKDEEEKPKPSMSEEEKCSKQAAELKARFPDLEVFQPLMKLKQLDTGALKDELKGKK